MTEPLTETPRSEIEDLLPWYANGRLTSAERTRVEAALAADPELARRLDLVREEMAETIAANEAITPDASRALVRLMAAIDAEPVRSRPVAAAKTALLDRLADLLADLAPRRLARVAAAVAVVVAVQAVAIGWLTGTRPSGDAGRGDWQTASQAETAPAGPTLLVAFAPDARIDRIADVLKRAGAEIAEGPKANGFFRLRPLAGHDAAAVAAALKGEGTIVTFVQPSP